MSLSSIYGNPFLGERKGSPLDDMAKVTAKPTPKPEPKLTHVTKATLAAEADALRKRLADVTEDRDRHWRAFNEGRAQFADARTKIRDHAIAREELAKARAENNKLAVELAALKESRDDSKSFASISQLTFRRVKKLVFKSNYGYEHTCSDPTGVTITF